ncbi:MAG: (deoxy)nucleoside triphosphate pyrophosphohydrolase [Bacteroidales bacterium]|nr:(deoxy)nucleoside triphosphate pyrophosphohydrolase [Bacteroidales bacterium]
MIEVSCAIIRNEEQKVLVVQRGEKSDHPFKWEFPGGKLNNDESAEDSIIREISEELDMSIIVIDELSPAEYDYGHKQIRLIPFVCDTLREKPVLNEHAAYRWVLPSELADIDLCEADMVVASEYCRHACPIQQTMVDAKDESAMPAPVADTVTDDELKAMIYRMMGSTEVDWIATSAASNPLLFRKLLEFTDETDTRLVFRASWALTKVCEKRPELFSDLLPAVVEKLISTDNGSAERSFLKILQLTGTKALDEGVLGRLADHCFTQLRSRTSAIAVKAYSMDVLYEISSRYPDLTHELAGVIGLLPDDVPAGIKAKSRALLKKLMDPAPPGRKN